MKAGKGRSNCTRTVAVVLSALTLLGGVACGKETGTVRTAQQTTEPAEWGQTETPRGPSAEKLVFEEAERQREEAAQNAPRAPKVPEATRVPSCPIDLGALTPGVHKESTDSVLFTVPPFRAITPINSAEVISALGVVYDAYAGSLVDDAQQGVVIVAQSEIDPCAALSPRSEPALYKTPSRSGAVTLTQIVGDTVIFNTPDGGTGQFNYHWSVCGVACRALTGLPAAAARRLLYA